jgi:predicted ester cyclase
MTEERFRAYIDAFNRDDYSSFGDYYDEDVVLVIAGKTELRGRQAIFDFYKTVKSQTKRTIQVNKVITAPDRLAAELETELYAFEDWPELATGAIEKGQIIRTQNFIWYEVKDGKFVHIRSARYRKLA